MSVLLGVFQAYRDRAEDESAVGEDWGGNGRGKHPLPWVHQEDRGGGRRDTSDEEKETVSGGLLFVVM